MKLLGKHYYTNPSQLNSTGDIWKDLPTFGLLKTPLSSGIVITPACDLANNKVETITYLPIIPIRQLFCSRSLYQIIRTEILVLIKLCSIELDDNIFNKNYLPKLDSFTHILTDLNKKKTDKKGKDLEYLLKLIFGLNLMGEIIDPNCTGFGKNQMKHFLGEKRFEDMKEKILRNSLSTDIHFLPKDEENVEWSAIFQHSVVLFRYPITIPIEIFDLASDVDCLNWDLSIDELSQRFPLAFEFKKKRPLKSLHLKQEFLGDLLTRYIGLYIRLGSQDFTDDIIVKFKDEII